MTTETAPTAPAGEGTTTTPPPGAPAPAPGAAPAGQAKSILAGSPTPQGSSTGEGKAHPPEGDKAGAEAPYELRLPEGVTFDKDLLDGYVKTAKEAGIPADQASRLAAWYAGAEKGRIEAAQKLQAAQSDKWYDDLAKDPTFGGASFQENAAHAQRALQRFGKPFGLDAELARLHLDNHPAIARTFAAIGRAFAEDTTRTARASAPAPKTEDERLARFYDQSNNPK